MNPALGRIDPVLCFVGKQAGISTVRALKHAILMLEQYSCSLNEALQGETCNAVGVAIDDLELMLARAEGKK